jgi:nucleotidyltransferase/DNA polymerase involved in DNA repair
MDPVGAGADLFRLAAGLPDGHAAAERLRERLSHWYASADRIGISLNPPLARMLAAPSAEGRTVLDLDHLAAAVAQMPLGEVPDILPREASRLNLRGVFTAAEFVALDEGELRRVMGSTRGAWWAKALRGEDVPPVAPSYLSRGLVLGDNPPTPVNAREAVRVAIRNGITALLTKGLTASEMWVEIASDGSVLRKRLAVRVLDPSALEAELSRRISLNDVPPPMRVSVRFSGMRPVEQPSLAFFESGESAA